jgi:hypothetical protein
MSNRVRAGSSGWNDKCHTCHSITGKVPYVAIKPTVSLSPFPPNKKGTDKKLLFANNWNALKSNKGEIKQ